MASPILVAGAARKAGPRPSDLRLSAMIGLVRAGLQMVTDRQFVMSAELLSHGGQHLVGKMVLATGSEPFEQ